MCTPFFPSRHLFWNPKGIYKDTLGERSNSLSSSNLWLFLQDFFDCSAHTLVCLLIVCVRPFAHERQASDRRQLFMEHYLHFFLGKKSHSFFFPELKVKAAAAAAVEILMQNATREAQHCFCQDLVHHSLLEMFFTLSISHSSPLCVVLRQHSLQVNSILHR